VIIWLCDGDDSRVVDGKRCAWCLEEDKCKTMEKLSISIFLAFMD
jgi:hypothetical protein